MYQAKHTSQLVATIMDTQLFAHINPFTKGCQWCKLAISTSNRSRRITNTHWQGSSTGVYCIYCIRKCWKSRNCNNDEKHPRLFMVYICVLLCWWLVSKAYSNYVCNVWTAPRSQDVHSYHSTAENETLQVTEGSDKSMTRVYLNDITAGLYTDFIQNDDN